MAALSGTTSDLLVEAYRLVSEGWRVTPLRPRSKVPLLQDWPNIEVSQADLHRYFTNGANLGLVCGSNGLCDVDLDCSEARALARLLLPPTPRRHGRASAPNSHWLYRADRSPAYLQIVDPDTPRADPGHCIVELRTEGRQTMMPPSIHPDTGEVLRYEERGLPELVRGDILKDRVRLLGALVLIVRSWPGKGSRHSAALHLAGLLLRRGIDEHEVDDIVTEVARLANDPEYADRSRAARDTAREHGDGGKTTGLPSLLGNLNASLARRELIHKLLARSDHRDRGSRAAMQRPELLPAALHGLAGDIVRAILPHTEADPAALLVTTLVCFGSAVGHGPHAVVEDSRHAINLFAVLVGPTSKGRKGSALSRVLHLFKHVEPDWHEHRVVTGLSSGEGLIHAVRDASEQVGEDGEPRVPGVEDKRLLAVEPEFASVLKQMARDGNILSPTLRQAWDSGNLRVLTKQSPTSATGAHISLLGHGVRDELLKYLSDTEIAGGGANRFLYCWVERSKLLPEGGGEPAYGDLVPRLHNALALARDSKAPISRDEQARDLWHREYPALSEGRDGLVGAITARAEAQVLRLSVVYALMDCASEVRVDHLQAALALWRFCEESTNHIFGDRRGDSVADRLLRAVHNAGVDGLSRTQLSGVLGRHVSSDRINAALDELLDQHLIKTWAVPPEGEKGKRTNMYASAKEFANSQNSQP